MSTMGIEGGGLWAGHGPALAAGDCSAVRLRLCGLERRETWVVRGALTLLARGLRGPVGLVVSGEADYVLMLPGWPAERALLMLRLMRMVAQGRLSRPLPEEAVLTSLAPGREAAEKLLQRVLAQDLSPTVLVGDDCELPAVAEGPRP